MNGNVNVVESNSKYKITRDLEESIPRQLGKLKEIRQEAGQERIMEAK